MELTGGRVTSAGQRVPWNSSSLPPSGCLPCLPLLFWPGHWPLPAQCPNSNHFTSLPSHTQAGVRARALVFTAEPSESLEEDDVHSPHFHLKMTFCFLKKFILVLNCKIHFGNFSGVFNNSHSYPEQNRYSILTIYNYNSPCLVSTISLYFTLDFDF
jgi:hypothetical protein